VFFSRDGVTAAVSCGGRHGRRGHLGRGRTGCGGRAVDAEFAAKDARCGRVDREPGADHGAGGVVDLVDQPRCQFHELPFFVAAVRCVLHIQVGEHAQQGRPNVHAVAARQRQQAVEARENGRGAHALTRHRGLKFP
jgi:hypothetical protein